MARTFYYKELIGKESSLMILLTSYSTWFMHLVNLTNNSFQIIESDHMKIVKVIGIKY